jgi:hypothetical protein
MDHSPRLTQTSLMKNLSPNSMLDETNETHEYKASQIDSINDNHKIQPFLKDNVCSFSSISDSAWTNAVNIESSRKAQKFDAKNNGNGIGSNNQDSLNTLQIPGQIAKFKRYSDNMYNTRFSPGQVTYFR